VLENAGVSPLGAPWGMETSTKAQRIAKAVSAGVDNFIGLADTAALSAAKTVGLTDAQVDASATRALKLMFGLGLFDNPYVDAAQARFVCNDPDTASAALDAMDRSMVLVLNAHKPAGWLLNGDQPGEDGTQTGDKNNSGNGTNLVLPAAPGIAYGPTASAYYIAGNFDLGWVGNNSAGYGLMTNNETIIRTVPTPTRADRIAASDYYFVRINAPATLDPDSGPLNYCKASLEYTSDENKAVNDALLAPIRDARAAITSHPGSITQIIVGVQGGRPSVLKELVDLGVNGVYLDWAVTDKVFLDVAFGIVNGRGKLPMGLPLSDAAMSTQKEDLAGDGQNQDFPRGLGLQTNAF
jgi:beta-glucosidase